jgi:hypothetical protein
VLKNLTYIETRRTFREVVGNARHALKKIEEIMRPNDFEFNKLFEIAGAP